MRKRERKRERERETEWEREVGRERERGEGRGGEGGEIQFILCSMLGEAGRDIPSPTRLCSGQIFPSVLR